jgi:CheY-like chemotaxis protein
LSGPDVRLSVSTANILLDLFPPALINIEIEKRLWMEKKILIVDDDTNIVEFLETLFQDNGYLTVTAQNAQEGLEVAKKELPDLITLDLEMPGEWGPRFYRKMSQDPNLKNTPVIVVSGLSGSEHAIGKAVAVVTKPFDHDELLKIVKETLG